MPLTFNIRHLEAKDLHLEGELPSAELELELHDELVHPTAMLEYDLEVERIEGAALVQGCLSLDIEYECSRCLKKFSAPLTIENWACHLPLTGEDATPITNDLVNLTPYVREDILLALPQHPLCEPECAGLKPPAILKEPLEQSEPAVSPWAELDKLKLEK